MGVCHFSLTTLQPHSSVFAFRSHFFRNVKKIFLPSKTEENIEEEGLVVFPPEMKRNQNNHFHSLQIFLLHRHLRKFFG
jgi:hypothetical protein